jgi:Na+-driven multidrug efflux pump
MIIIIKFAYNTGATLTNVRLFFHKIFFYMNIVFPHLPQTLYAGRVKLFFEASEFFLLLVFQLFVDGKTASSKSVLQGTNKWKSYRVISGMFRAREKKIAGLGPPREKSWLDSFGSVKIYC